jgi:hypothetical protein
MDGLLARARALLHLEGPRSDEVERALSQASKLIGETGARSRAAAVHELRAELARARGDRAAAVCELREADRLYREIGATGHAARVERELG